jgi:hypothetical protein
MKYNLKLHGQKLSFYVMTYKSACTILCQFKKIIFKKQNTTKETNKQKLT